MSASSIPNLLSLRNGRGGRGGRGGAGRSRGGLSAGPSQSHDSNIQNTDTDAAVSRYSAVEAGYLDDIYASYFVSRADGPPARRFPIINRGTYTRTTALDRLLDAFLSPSSSDGSTPSQRQIISLGAGTDTRPFRLFSQPSTSRLVYHEVDFDVISKRKFQTIQGNPSLSRILTEASPTEGQTWTSKPANGGEYYCHGVDLRELDKSIETPLTGLRPDVPTLVLSECCLCYLKHEEAARVVTYFTSRISNLSLIIYEPVHLDDAFGKTMVSNLAARGIRMPGLDHCRNSDDQISRLRDAGFEAAKCLTVDEIWEQWVEEGEKERIHGLERLDEVEEWKLLAGHYIVVWGCKGSGLGTMSDI